MTTWAELGITEKTVYVVESTTTFKIYNAGDEKIDPRSKPLVIEFRGTSTNLSIKNLTTLDTWSYTGTTLKTDFLKIAGVRSLKNGLSIFKDTNRKLITLQPGWNEFELTGTQGFFRITFQFRFNYL